MKRCHAKKVRDEGHWQAAVDGRVLSGHRHDTPAAAVEEARWTRLSWWELAEGEERLVTEIAKELGLPRRFIESIADDREGYHLHVGDQVGCGIYSRPKSEWTLFREEGTS